MNGTCQSEYVGTGQLAEYAALLDDLDRERAEAQRAALQAEIEAIDQIDREIDTLLEIGRAAIKAVLLTSGYHTHKRQWRKKRYAKSFRTGQNGSQV